MAQMGRPKVDKPKDIRVAFRVTQDEYKVLTEYANKNNLSISEVLHKGMKLILQSRKQH